MKKLFHIIFFIIIMSVFSSVTAFAEGYIFSTTENFPLPRSSSIEIISYENNVYKVNSLEEIEYLIEQGIVENYEENIPMELFEYTPSDPYFPSQENLTEISAPFAWNKNLFGNKVKVAVIDTGISNDIEDFNYDNIIKAADYTPTKDTAFCEDDVNLDHGTKVSSVIISAHNDIGIAGVAPNVELYMFKYSYYDYTPILDENGEPVRDKDGKIQFVGAKGYTDDIIQGIYDAIKIYDCDIINISAGSRKYSYYLHKAVDYAEEKGVIVVAAAGNYGTDELCYPASYDSVISVGFSTKEGYRHSLSQKNDYVNIIAPGTDIYCITRQDGIYTETSGSSFASPTVAGAVALAKEMNPNLTPAQIREALYVTADPMYDNPETKDDESLFTGSGKLNIHSFLTYAQALSNKGSLVYSFFDSSACAYCLPLEGYKSYFARFNDNTMTDIKETGIKVPSEAFSEYMFYVWKKNTLEPYGGNIPVLKY